MTDEYSPRLEVLLTPDHGLDMIETRANLHGQTLAYVSDVDRRYFSDHPQTSWYLRQEIEHEACLLLGGCVEPAGRVIVVMRAALGCRARTIAMTP